jgi:hypothetical protein
MPAENTVIAPSSSSLTFPETSDARIVQSDDVITHPSTPVENLQQIFLIEFLFQPQLPLKLSYGHMIYKLFSERT